MKSINKKNTTASPATDILEMKDGFHIIIDLPGVSPEDLIIDIEDSELRITGHSKYILAQSGLRQMHTEFNAQTYERIFTLSDLVDRENVKANLKDGVLRLFLPKAEAMKPRRIPVSS